MVKFLFKRWIGWVIGVLVASYAFSLWRDENIDWTNVITMSIGGAIGMLIVEGIKKGMKNGKKRQ